MADSTARGLISRKLCCAVSSVCLVLTAPGRADEPTTPVPPVAIEQHNSGDVGPDNRLLVLTNGRMVEGRISQNAGGYVVDKPTGSMLVPHELVRLVAEDREDAYRKMRATTAPASPSAHVELANWCLRNQYFDEAAAELRHALHLAPDRDDVRRMLRRLEEIRHPDLAVPAGPPAPGRTPDGFELPESISLAELPPETAHTFVRRVQPLLMNKCATSGCHSSSDNNRLRLERTRFGSGSRRIATERNLAACLKFIDPHHPEQSPLLAAPRGNHDRGGRPVFHGASAADQIELLRSWVRQAAADVAGRSRRDGQRPAFPLSSRTTDERGGPHPATGPAATLSDRAGRPLESEGLRLPAGSSDPDEELEALLQEDRDDPFDPEVFNRKARRSQ